MKNQLRILTGLTIVLISVYSCKSSKEVSGTSTVAVAEVSNSEKISNGKSWYESQCSACHSLKEPSRIRESEWREVVPEMVHKANRKAGSTVISPEMQDAILAYLVQNCKK